GVMAAAQLVLQRCAIEPIVHYTCQSRTLLDMISDLLGAASGDVRNLLVLSGEPPPGGPYREYASVIDVDSIGLINVVSGLNAGIDPSGNDIGTPTEFVIGVALNQGARDTAREAGRLYWKADAGAHYAVTQPVFDADQLFAFLDGIEGVDLPILAGIWPLTSARQAEYLQNEVPGVYVPTSVTERMRKAEELGSEAALEEGLALARKVVSAVSGRVRGLHVVAPGGQLEPALSLLHSARPG
ncbi:MAG: methylenetetrahydrofolate reductase, partial [Gemmatimonadota bacterium]|nr:methylenetetrahydrofolate reductase [Gemmatimonadota bacterium]